MRRFGLKLREHAAAVLLGLFAMLIVAIATSRDALAVDLTTPSFLVSTRDLHDPFFAHSVILMVPSTEPPLIAGLIINSPAKQHVRDLYPQVRPLKGAQDSIYQGGPVAPDEVSVIFRSPSSSGSAARVFGDTYVTLGHDEVAAVVNDARITDFRVIEGRAQWSRDQLASEVMEGDWYVVPAKSDLVFSDPKDLWSELVKGGDLEEAAAALASPRNLPFSRLDGTN